MRDTVDSHLSDIERDMVMSLPAGCDIVRLDMRIVGGIGTNPASLIVSGLSLGKAAAAN